MIRKNASPEVEEKIKSFERIDFAAFKELINQGQVKQFCKLKKPRTIFYDQQTANFLYLNPYHATFQKCGEWMVNPNI
jgi:hypothetical protein